VEDELEFHLETKTEDLIASGMSPTEARREAERQFGGVHAIREECSAIGKRREIKASRMEYLSGWLRDFEYALRLLRKSKASSAAAILILTIGIGAATAVFTLLDRLLYAPLPVPNPSELLLMRNVAPAQGGKRNPNEYFPYDAYVFMRDHNATFAGLAAASPYAPDERRGREKIDHPAQTVAVSSNYFPVLGVRPMLGRALAPYDDASAARVAVASYRFSSRRFGRAPEALGSVVYLNDAPFTIVGVLPAGFFGIDRGSDPDLYIPLASVRGLVNNDPLQNAGIRILGRLRPGVRAQAAEDDLERLWEQMLPASMAALSKFAAVQFKDTRIEYEDLSSGTAGVSGEKRRTLMLVGGIVALLLLMACANVACLLVARGAARQQEIAIRLSLGAGKARVLRQALIESCMLSVLGGAAGLLVAYWADRLLLAAFQWQKRPIDLTPDWRVLAFGLGLSLAIGILFGLAPAMQFLRGARVSLNQERTVAPRFGAGKPLVVIEVALSLAVVAGSAVFIRSLQNLRSVPTGFSPDHVAVVSVTSPDQEMDMEALRAEASDALRLTESLRGAPGFEAVSAADLLTFNDSTIGYVVAAADAPDAKRGSNVLRVDGAYFNALRIPLIAGRTFTERDDASSPRVVILAEGTARRLFPDRNPLGLRIVLGKSEPEVVGIVKDIKFTSVTAAAPDEVFQPMAQSECCAFSATTKIQVRSRMAPKDVAAIVRARIRELRLPLNIESVRTLEDAVGASMLNDRIRMQASGVFGALALLLIIAGVYGLMAYSVARRTREIGIRVAVGSSPGKIVGLVLGESLKLVLLGVLVGVPGAVAVMKAIHGMVFGLSPVDPLSLGASVVALCLTGTAASAIPAWRAARLDPVRALRVE
jgi:predicted permease